MYLKGSKWTMNRRRRQRPNWFRIILLCLFISAGLYLDKYVIPTQPSPFESTPTPTRPPESYLTEARALFDQGKLLQAIQTYQEAIAIKPDDPAIYVEMARVQVFAGEYKDAQTSAEDALLLNPNNSTAHAVRAWALDFQGNYLEAEASIKRALELDPNNALAHAYNTEILVDLGPEKIQSAIEESKVTLALAPNTLESHRARAYVLEATANYEDAIREYQEAIKINANIPDLHLAVGRNYRALGIYDKAVEEFSRANALNPSDPTPDYLISRTYATVGEFAKAMQYAETAVSDDPTDASLRGNLGVMYYYNAFWPDAVKELSLAVGGGMSEDGHKIDPVQLVPNSPRVAEYYFTYALVLAKLNRCGEALQVAQTILGRVPSDENAVNNAKEAIGICQKNLASPPTSLPASASTAAPRPAAPLPTPTP